MKSSTLKMSAQGIKLRTIRIEHYLYVSAFLVCDQNSLRTSLHLVFQGVIKRKIPRLIAGFAPFTNHSYTLGLPIYWESLILNNDQIFVWVSKIFLPPLKQYENEISLLQVQCYLHQWKKHLYNKFSFIDISKFITNALFK